MEVTLALVDRIAELSKLGLSPEEKLTMVKEMTKMLKWMEQLNSVNTEGVDPLVHLSDVQDRLREDERATPLSAENALQSAPKKDSSYFRVPKVIGDE